LKWWPMTDLTPSQWREIEQNSAMHDGYKMIALGVLRTILRKRRTNDQNALLWALYDDALKKGGEALGGWSRDDVHEYMLGEYWGWDVCEAFGRKRMKPKRRSSRLTKMEFSDFVEFVVRRFAEHGIVLQLPGEIAA
jgi:hypothetical protein